MLILTEGIKSYRQRKKNQLFFYSYTLQLFFPPLEKKPLIHRKDAQRDESAHPMRENTLKPFPPPSPPTLTTNNNNTTTYRYRARALVQHV